MDGVQTSRGCKWEWKNGGVDDDQKMVMLASLSELVAALCR